MRGSQDPASPHTSARVAIALGSNLSDRQAQIDSAIHALCESVLSDARVSGVIETEPDPPGPEPRYLNAVLIGRTALAPRVLLDRLLAIERAHGRERSHPNAPRTLDLDLILYGDAVIDEPGLIVPHPRFRARRFVLEPLAEIASDWRDPVTGLRIRELLDRLATRR